MAALPHGREAGYEGSFPAPGYPEAEAAGNTPVQVTTKAACLIVPPPNTVEETDRSRIWSEQWKSLDLSTKAALWVWRK